MSARGQVVSSVVFVLFFWSGTGASQSPSPLELRNAALSGPPPNLHAGAFQSLIDRIWQASPTFRRQCLRVGGARSLKVTLRADLRANDRARATTRMHRSAGTLVAAEVVLFSLPDATELIAHELEHVVEQLDEVVLKKDRCGTWAGSNGEVSESCRAVEVGLRVVREVKAAEQGRLMMVPLGEQSSGRLGPGAAAIGSAGRFVALRSAARLAAADRNDLADIYVLDLQTGSIQLESPHPGWADAYTELLPPDISADGESLVFLASAQDDALPTGIRTDVVLLDRATGTARAINGSARGDPRPTAVPVISANGGTVAYEALAVADVKTEGYATDIRLAHPGSGRIERVSVVPPAAAAPPDTPVGTSGGASDARPAAPRRRPEQNVAPAVSADGRYVAFASIVYGSCDAAGRCQQSTNRRDQRSNVYLRDTETGLTTRISRSVNGGEPDGPSSWPAISADGRFVVFASAATNLVKGDNNRQMDIFLHDRQAGTTELISRRRDGAGANGPSELPAISGDGATIAFQSLASDLLCARSCTSGQRDINQLSDVFVYERASRTTIRASGDAAGEWFEPSRRPSLDYSGRVVIFLSRHPIDDQDVENDDDLFVWMRDSSTAG